MKRAVKRKARGVLAPLAPSPAPVERPVEPLERVVEPVVELATDPASVSVDADRERRLTRAAAARILGIGITTLRRGEQTGEIPYSVDAQGVHRFSEFEVRAYGARLVPAAKRDSEGERHARAFAHFDGGGSPQSAVVALRCTFPEAERFYRDWSSGSGLVFTRAQIEELESLGVTPSAPEIIAVVRRLRERLREARAAQDRPRSLEP